jgi:drug/metabolite transporter (DMT)-like permease
MTDDHAAAISSPPAAGSEAAAPPAASVPVSRATAYGLMLVVVAIWGSGWPIAKIGLTWIPPLWFGFGRAALCALTLFLVLALRGQLRLPGRQDLPIVLSIGIVQVGVFMALMHFSLSLVAAGRAAILAYTSSLWVVPAALLFLGERLSPLRGLGLAAGLGGVAVLFNPFGFDWSNGEVILGNVLLLVCAMCWGIGILHVKVHRWHLSPLQLAPWQMVIGMIPSLAAALVTEDPSTIVWDWRGLVIVFAMGSIGTALPFWALLTLNRALPAISTSLGLLAVPAVGLFSSMAILGEELTPTLAAGFVLILIGVGLVATADRR